MRFFADTADIVEIRDLQNANLIQGVTTNPTLVQRAGRKDFTKCMEEICDIVEGPVSAEVTSPTYLEMVKQGIELATIAHNIVVKLPCDIEGMKACKTLSDKGIEVNMTLCFSVAQYTLASNAGARYVSPFIGRLDDNFQDGIGLIKSIYSFKKKSGDGPDILAASIRGVGHINDAAEAGADIVTVPASTIFNCMKNTLTIDGIKRFKDDWNKLQQ